MLLGTEWRQLSGTTLCILCCLAPIGIVTLAEFRQFARLVSATQYIELPIVRRSRCVPTRAMTAQMADIKRLITLWSGCKLADILNRIRAIEFKTILRVQVFNFRCILRFCTERGRKHQREKENAFHYFSVIILSINLSVSRIPVRPMVVRLRMQQSTSSSMIPSSEVV